LAHAARDDFPQAKRTLSQALALAQPEGYRRLFLDAGEPLATLLRATFQEMREEPLVSYAHSLLGAMPQGRAGKSSARPVEPGLLVEPLSAQEQRVLRLLAAGLSNGEIAQELVVSINTVKTHVKAVYRKLRVYSRREARAAARQLALE
jgi:LuxR family maltose regulon positive regulatory protein